MSQSAITQSTSTIAAVSPTTTTGAAAMESNPSNPTNHPQDFLTHLESYLSKRDGVDKLLKITRYTTKIILSTTPTTTTIASKPSNPTSASAAKPSASANSSKTSTHSAPQTSTPYTTSFSPSLHTAAGAWAELIGYVGSIGLKVRDLKGILEAEMCLVKRVESGDEELEKLREKKLLKKLGLVQDVADGLMAVADVHGGKGRLSVPVLLALAGLLSAVRLSTSRMFVGDMEGVHSYAEGICERDGLVGVVEDDMEGVHSSQFLRKNGEEWPNGGSFHFL
ncbi:hypothetical protein HanOQP8_Chr16g0607541 [Helianthus annuus]|nr:hypothetical protein HanLR1_Chr16g0611321 [Helianthus annuus]KAJ0644051.1 hypothetical protein HanOQP8_Chr16g0607541 [Helianthus annuus]KAJ0820267.1 hypothetical protein HanPSC8_Chr16g0705901 [Helianthus annuus]